MKSNFFFLNSFSEIFSEIFFNSLNSDSHFFDPFNSNSYSFNSLNSNSNFSKNSFNLNSDSFSNFSKKSFKLNSNSFSKTFQNENLIYHINKIINYQRLCIFSTLIKEILYLAHGNDHLEF